MNVFQILSAICIHVCLSVCTVGPLCMYKEGPSSAFTREDCSTTFADYFATLQQVCEAGQPGVLHWTPDTNTSDTVYYQVYGGGGGGGGGRGGGGGNICWYEFLCIGSHICKYTAWKGE